LEKKNISGKEHALKLKSHNTHQKSCICFYNNLKTKSLQSKEDFFCIIHDKMDPSKTALPRLQVKNKLVIRVGQLPITLNGMIVHGRDDEAFT